MSRIGKLPVNLPAGVTVEVLPGNVVKVKGPLGELSQKVDVNINVAVEGTPCNTIKIALKYHPQTKTAAIKKIERVSKPGLRRYTDVENMPRVLNGLGIAILSTSKGVITDKEARDLNVGGEVICYVY